MAGVRIYFRNGAPTRDSLRRWGRSAARSAWGMVQSQGAVRLPSIPGFLAWYSTPGHGGYILVAPIAEVPRHFERFKVSSCRDWAAYAFEEDCDWAVLYLAYPQLASASATVKRYPNMTPAAHLWAAHKVVARYHRDLAPRQRRNGQ